MNRYDVDKAAKIIMRLKGPHQPAVRHPSEMYPGFDSWSTAAK